MTITLRAITLVMFAASLAIPALGQRDSSTRAPAVLIPPERSVTNAPAGESHGIDKTSKEPAQGDTTRVTK